MIAPSKWENWYLTIKNKHNFATVELNTCEEILECLSSKTEKVNWKIYLTLEDNTGGVFKSSNLVEYNPEEGYVKTARGSTYFLGKEKNQWQTPNLENYFSEENIRIVD